MAKTLLLVGGHGAGDPGACGNGKIEADEARRVNQALYNMLKGKIPLEIYNTGKDLYQSNDHAAYRDYEVVETHFNAFNCSANGTEVLIKSGFSADALDNGLLYAMAKYFTNRGIKQKSDLANMNKFANMGTSYRLIEVCFIDSADMAVYNSRFDALITDMANAILKAYGVPQDTPVKPKSQSINVSLQKNTGADNQRWAIEKVGEYMRLKNKATGLYLDLAGASTKNESNIQAYIQNGTDAQLWNLVHIRDGEAEYILFKPKLAHGKYMSVAGNAIGGNIKLYDDLKNSKQRFYLRLEKDGYYIITHVFTFGAVTAA